MDHRGHGGGTATRQGAGGTAAPAGRGGAGKGVGGAAARGGGGGKNGHPPAKPAGVGKPPGKAGFASQMAQQKPLLKVPPKAPAATGSR